MLNCISSVFIRMVILLVSVAESVRALMYVCMYVCMYVWSILLSRVWITRVRLPILARGQLNTVPAWEFDIARQVRPSRPASVCSFTLRLNLVLTHEIPLAFSTTAVHIIPSTAIRSVSPEFIESRSCLFRFHHGPIFMRLSFSHTHY